MWIQVEGSSACLVVTGQNEGARRLCEDTCHLYYKGKDAFHRRRGQYLPVPQAEGVSGSGVVSEPTPPVPAHRL